jgi:magnesium-transporting ATPase (P-type)
MRTQPGLRRRPCRRQRRGGAGLRGVTFLSRLGYTVEKRTSEEIILKKEREENGKKTTSKFEILETIPFSSEDQLTGMFVKERTDEGATYNRLLLKGSPASIKKLVTDTTMNDFAAGGLQTICFAEAELTEKEWTELVLFVGDTTYRRDQNSTKVNQVSGKVFY